MRYSRGRYNKKCPDLLVNRFLHRIILNDEESRNMCQGINKRNFYFCLNNEIYEWCHKTYGKYCIEWGFGLKKKTATVYFKTKEDAMAFKLRWA